ncbi:MAG: MalY/PatB family protein [Solibacillus sp.]
MQRFDETINRKQTQSYKWDKLKEVYNLENVEDLLPMWVADMDFAAPAVMSRAIEKRLATKVFGYTYADEDLKVAISHWFTTRHQWTIDPSTILFKQGVVPAIATIIETFTAPGDKIAMCTPVYPPFFNVPQAQNRLIVTCDLIENDGHYTIDFDALEQLFKDGAKLFILCNPHNPIGIVWSRQQLEQLVALCIQYDVYLLSDEIHADILFKGPYTPIFTIDWIEKAKVITCIAPTKTFNVAGIQLAMVVAENPDIRKQLELTIQRHAELGPNIFALDAAKALYTDGAEWLDALLVYLQRNIDYVREQLNALDGISVQAPDGTYLMWVDTRATGFAEKALMQSLLTTGKLALEPGSKYGVAGTGFFRMNIACPFDVVKDGVERFKLALSSLQQK